MLINVKMPTIVGSFTFMISIYSMLSCVEHEKKFYNLESWKIWLPLDIPHCYSQNLRNTNITHCFAFVESRMAYSKLNMDPYY